MSELTDLSSRIIDEGITSEPVNRITQRLGALADRLAIVESFSHVVILTTEEGLVLFDTSSRFTGPSVLASLRAYSDLPIHSLVYTHGHVDHVGGAAAFVEEARTRGRPDPRVVAHENVPRRLDRYEATSGYNLAINRRQFDMGDRVPERFLPPGTPRPVLTFTERLVDTVGGVEVELTHARGETDDHLWAWLPAERTICAGDFFIWSFPNAGNPQKVQRYPLEWAAALRAMAAKGAELFVPAHGLPIAGAERIRRVLHETAGALEKLVADTLACMNAGLTLEQTLGEVRVEAELLRRPYLRPTYDEPEFIVRNVWRLYGGWYDGDPARLKPPTRGAVAREIAAITGGALPLIERARARADAGDLRLACELVELAVAAEPENKAAHQARYELYRARRKAESSLMAKGIFGNAAKDSFTVAHPGEPWPHTADDRLRM